MDSQGNSELQPGDVLQAERYEITQLLRSARDKDVYLAQDRVLDCKVTVDVFSSNSSIMPSGLTVSAWEASVLGQLGNHPNIATVLHYWEDEKTATMVSRYLPGGNLRDVIARSQESGDRLPVERILQFSTEIARGLEYIHGRRIMYRDLQPCNVLLDEWGAVHLVDFDTAVSLDDHDMSDLSQRPVIAYTAPELTDGGSADERADLYSLGATIYEMAAGHPPFAGTRDEILTARRAGPPRLERDDLPETLRDLVFRLLALDPEHRPASAAEVVQQLDGHRADRSEIERLLSSDETTRLELKSSLRTPIEPLPNEEKGQLSKVVHLLERGVLKTIAAFLNTDGGTLIIGITDDHAVIGIEVDYPSLKRQSSDGWRCAFDDLVSAHLGTEVTNYVKLQLEPWHGCTIAIVRCSKREEPTLVDDDELFVRRTASTVKLSAREALAWWRERQPRP